MQKFPAIYQFIRYGIVGVINNLLGYLIYLFVTFFWLEPKIAITLFYPIGALTGYFGHLKYSFAYQGKHRFTLIRYGIAHFIGYSINFMMLVILVDKLKFPHQAVQASAIFVVASALFLMFRYFVFPRENYRKIEPNDFIASSESK
ncbi:MAG: GtrA family protein [Tatlockia sp.]|nr:GtrA family protein [Tatlockia sp.]